MITRSGGQIREQITRSRSLSETQNSPLAPNRSARDPRATTRTETITHEDTDGEAGYARCPGWRGAPDGAVTRMAR